MNFEQLLNKYTKLHYEEYSLNDNHVLDDLLELKKELIPEVPQDVADWYETYKDQFEFNVWNYIYDYEKNDDSYFKTWINDPDVDALKILVNMHQFGYTIKKRKSILSEW